MDVKQSQKAGNNAIQIQQTVVGDNNYVVGIEIENDSRKPNDNQPKRSLLRRLSVNSCLPWPVLRTGKCSSQAASGI